MAGLTLLFAGVLAFADRKLRVEEDPKITEINALLPGVNCGACGYLSCHDFAEHIVKDNEDPSKCRVVGEEAKHQLMVATGREGGESFPYLPLVHCAAECQNKEPVAEYKGIRKCSSSVVLFGGGMQCQYGCMGFGDCTEACPFDALHMVNGLPRVDEEKCTGCGQCEKACPRGIITMQEKREKHLYYVACSSHDKGPRVREICGVGCIGCGICEKLDPEKFFIVTDLLSRADFSKQKDQEKCEFLAGKCPTKVIKKL